MHAMLKPLITTVALLGLVIVSPAFVNAGSYEKKGLKKEEPSNCIVIKGKYFQDGERVKQCKKAEPYKAVTPATGINHPDCEGKRPGHMFLDEGPDGKRMAIYRCR